MSDSVNIVIDGNMKISCDNALKFINSIWPNGTNAVVLKSVEELLDSIDECMLTDASGEDFEFTELCQILQNFDLNEEKTVLEFKYKEDMFYYDENRDEINTIFPFLEEGSYLLTTVAEISIDNESYGTDGLHLIQKKNGKVISRSGMEIINL